MNRITQLEFFTRDAVYAQIVHSTQAVQNFFTTTPDGCTARYGSESSRENIQRLYKS